MSSFQDLRPAWRNKESEKEGISRIIRFLFPQSTTKGGKAERGRKKSERSIFRAKMTFLNAEVDLFTENNVRYFE